MEQIDNKMKEFIQKIEAFSKQEKLSYIQTVFLFSIYSEVYSCDINANELLELVSKGYMNGNKLATKSKEIISTFLMPQVHNIEEIAICSQSFRITNESGQIVKRLATHFLGNMFHGSEYRKIMEVIKDPIKAPFFFIFMQMFPSSDKEKNIHWNKHFESEWDNVTLRRVTNGTVNKFNEIYRTKDIGLFLLGTYLFIKASYNQEKGKYYVKAIENYFKEYKHWYENAKETIERGELNHLIQKKQQKATQSNTTII